MPQNGFDVNVVAKTARTETSCGAGACPALLTTSRGTFVIVGLKMSDGEKAIIGKAGGVAITASEDAVEVPQELIDQIRHLAR